MPAKFYNCLRTNQHDTGNSFHGGIVVSQSVQHHTYVELQPLVCSLPIVKIRLVTQIPRLLFVSPQTTCWRQFGMHPLQPLVCSLPAALIRLVTLMLFVFSLFFLSSCSLSKKISKQADTILIKDTIINTGHIGICIYEPATDKYLYNHNADKYFVPASNVKLFSSYAVLKYLGDSLPGLKYRQTKDGLSIYPTGDPTFLHPDFKQQPVFDFLKNKSNLSYVTQHFKDGLGEGWAWDDYLDDYMVQRSEFPIYANLIRLYNNGGNFSAIPKNISVHIQKQPEKSNSSFGYNLFRKWDDNDVTITPSSLTDPKDVYTIPLVPDMLQVIQFISDTLHKKISISGNAAKDSGKEERNNLVTFYSRPTDSLLKPMLYNSDNFFAEQSLLMVSEAQLGYMSVAGIIDTLLKTNLVDMPQKPRWVDGSGLSRYNLFTPQCFVYILNKMLTEFGAQRLQRILPTGGNGTLKNYYQKDSTFIYAKTGSLGNVLAISGLLYSKKGKMFIFSVLMNNFEGSATKVRRSVEKFLEGIRNKY